uniref:G protein-coupled receptor n=1 Tax=Angiostrongylus cantonensis TaxID=6313 RepID=A0A0K0D343_ANGCA
LEIVLAVLTLIANCIMTVITHNAIPVPYPQRRTLASISFNFVLLAGYQLARNLFFGVSMYKPCITMVTTLTCKQHEFPLLFCYIHGAMAVFILIKASVFRPNHRPSQWTSMCSVWQSALIVVCIAATLVFTAFDHDLEPQKMGQCSILLALRDPDLTFCLLTLLILLHAASAAVASFSAPACLTISLREVFATETVLWHFSLFFSGCCVVYRHIVTDSCDDMAFYLFFLSYFSIYLIFTKSILRYVFPMRDAAVRAYPCLRLLLPEYAMVPPPPVYTGRRGKSCKFNVITSNMQSGPLSQYIAILVYNSLRHTRIEMLWISTLATFSTLFSFI